MTVMQIACGTITLNTEEQFDSRDSHLIVGVTLFLPCSGVSFERTQGRAREVFLGKDGPYEGSFPLNAGLHLAQLPATTDPDEGCRDDPACAQTLTPDPLPRLVTLSLLALS